MKPLNEWTYALFSLLFPRICASCGTSLFASEEVLCRRCIQRLPATSFELLSENPVSQLFWGRCKIDNATSAYFYKKGERVQQLLHELKYRGNTNLGCLMGSLLGQHLLKPPYYQSIDYIIPVPLHPKKQQQRGYNQSEFIAKGIAEQMEIPVDTDSLKRIVYTNTQTRKGRYDRWKNVSGIFKVFNANIVGKHVLIVDDVVTTGSTIEACVNALNEIPGVKVSVATFACAYL